MNLFHQVWGKTKRVLRAVGDFQARVLLTIFYLVLVAPIGLTVRALADPLRVKAARRARDSYWESRGNILESEDVANLLIAARRQG